MELRATLKEISEARNKYEPEHRTFQLLKVADNGADRWLFKHNADKEELQKRFLITKMKLQDWNQRKRERWGHANA